MGEFQITGPGTYRRRDGSTDSIRERNGGRSSNEYWPWYSDTTRIHYRDNGRSDIILEHSSDIVAGPLPDQPELASLRGYGIFRQGYCTFVPPHELAALNEVSAGEIIIDLTTIRTDQIVKLRPKRETRKVTLVMWKNGAVDMWHGPPPMNPTPNPDIVAIVEREFEFTVGEGLEVKP